MDKIVLTGAAGHLGSYLREPVLQLCDSLTSSDLVNDIGDLYQGENYVQTDLADYDQVHALLEGADIVVHFGAHSDEAEFNTILGSNIVGAYNVWEAAYRQGVRRVVYASSIHAVGMHANKDFIGIDARHRPDTFYGLAKCFAEDLASLYWDKRGIESVCMRILSCAPVTSARALGTWLSYDDLIHLVECAITTPVTGFNVLYGVSNNDRVPVDNSAASLLGYRPKDNAEQFAAAILAKTPPLEADDPEHRCVGGPFAAVPLGDSGLALMNSSTDKKYNSTREGK